ncbi:MAG: AI-2E family transporter [Muribaculaceae bacterium]|nr:AI-2E family transporter [Muribaculaceae bacterium]
MEKQVSDTVSRRPFTFDRVVRIIISTIAILGALWLIDRLSSVLLPFLVAWLIAYLLEPFVQRNRHFLKTEGRLVAVVLTLVEVLLLIIVLCIAFLPAIFDEMHQVAALIREYAVANDKIKLVPPAVHEFLLKHLDFKQISDILTRQNIESLVDFLGSFLTGGVNFLMSLFDVFLVILYVMFIMLDYEKLLAGFRKMVPPRYRDIVFALFDNVKDSMNHYFRGQALIAFLVGILFSIGFLIIGLPLAVILGMFIGALNMVPYLQLISLPITSILCLVYSVQDSIDFWPLWWEAMAVYCVVQVIQDMFLTPKIMGKAMGMNPAIILFSLSVWGSLLGIIGMIIALPLTTLLISYYNHLIINRNDGESMRERLSEARALRDIVEDD